MYGDVIDPKRFEIIALLRLRNLALLIDLGFGLLQFGQNITALILGTQVQHLSKYRACAIQVRCRSKGNEELAAIDGRACRILRPRCRLVLDWAGGH